MLTRNQSEKVEVAFSLIQEVKREIIDLDYSKAALLTKASDACEQVLQEDLPEGYELPKMEICYIKEKYEPTVCDKFLTVLGWVAGTSLLASALSACIALSCWGISEFKSASHWKTNTDYAAETRGYRGLCFTFLGITLTSSLIAAVVSDVRDRDW